MGFFAQNNQKGLLFHIQLEEMVNEICKAQTNDLKFSLYVLIGSSFERMFLKQKYSLGSYLIVKKEIKEKSPRKFSRNSFL